MESRVESGSKSREKINGESGNLKSSENKEGVRVWKWREKTTESIVRWETEREREVRNRR